MLSWSSEKTSERNRTNECKLLSHTRQSLIQDVLQRQEMMSPYYSRLRDAVGNGLLLIPSVAAVIHDRDGQLLLVQDADDNWSLRAGAIEPGETPEQAIRREVREETGIAADPVEILAVVGGAAYRYTYPNAHEAEYVVILYRCNRLAEGEIEDTGEVARTCYFARPDCPPLALPYDMNMLYATRTKAEHVPRHVR